jgi:hypothetical protein
MPGIRILLQRSFAGAAAESPATSKTWESKCIHVVVAIPIAIAARGHRLPARTLVLAKLLRCTSSKYFCSCSGGVILIPLLLASQDVFIHFFDSSFTQTNPNV